MLAKPPETVEHKLKRLRGAPLTLYKMKWRNLIEKLQEIYKVRDPQLLGLPYTLDDLDSIVKWVLGLCSGLTDSECANKIEEEIRKHGELVAWKDEANDIKEYIEHLEEKASEIRRWQNIFRLPIDIDEYTAEQLKELYENPELNHDTVYNIIKNYALNLGYPEEEADSIARKSAEALDKIVEARNRHLATAEWTQILNYSAVKVKLELERRKRKAKNFVEKFIETYGKVKGEGVYSENELETLLLYKVEKAKKAKNPSQAIELLVNNYGAREAIITPPAKLIKFSDRPLWCKVREVELKSRSGAMIVNVITECNQPALLVKTKEGKLYYQKVKVVRQ